MDERLAKQYDLLQNDVGALAYSFREYRTMFGVTRERIGFLDKVAPVFFRMLFQTLWGDMLMQLTRVTGPKTTGRPPNEFENLTLRRLPDLVDDEAYRVVLQGLVDAAVTAAEFATPARNKVYAHRDLTIALDPDASTVTLGSREQMSAAIAAVEAVLDSVARRYEGVRSSYYHDIGWGVAEDVLHMLEVGWRAHQRELAAKEEAK